MGIFGGKMEFTNSLGSMTSHILDWYDGPLLLKCRNEKNEHFLCILFDRERAFEQWLYVPMSESRMNDFLHGRVSLRNAITKCEFGELYLVDTHYEEEVRSEHKKINHDDLTEDDLPSEDSYDNYSEIEFED